MRGSGRQFIILGGILVFASVLLLLVVMRSGGSESGGDGEEPNTGPAPVVVAKRDIRPNEVLTADDVEVKEVDPAPMGAARNVQQVVGMALNVGVEREGSILTQNLVTPPLSATLSTGERAVALPINRLSAIGGLVRTDDHVDVMYSIRLNLSRVFPTEPVEITDSTGGHAEGELNLPPFGQEPGPTYPFPGEPGSRILVKDLNEGHPVTKVILQNLRVIRVIAGNTQVETPSGQAQDPSQQGQAGQAGQGANATPTPNTLPNPDLLVLAVNPQQAEILKFLQDNNQGYQIALRAQGDNTVETTTGTTYDVLVSQWALPVPRTVTIPGGGQ